MDKPILLQFPHRANEISGVRTFVESAQKALESAGAAATIFPSADKSRTEVAQAVASCSIVHLNSNHTGLLREAKRQKKPIVLMYHYPFWGGDVPYPADRRKGLISGFTNYIRYRYRLGGADRWKPWYLNYSLNCHARAIGRIATAWLMDGLLAPTKFIAENAALPWPVRVCNYCIDCDPAALKRPTPARARFCFMGRVDAQKGVDLIVQALAILTENERSNCHIDVIGDGSALPSVRQLAAELKVDQFITFHGKLARAQALEMLDNSSALIVPSRWDDPSPYVVLEASSRARMTLGAARGGIPEIIGPGPLFENEDSKGLAAQMAQIIRAPGSAKEVGEKAFHFASVKFAPARAAQELIQFYNQFL